MTTSHILNRLNTTFSRTFIFSIFLTLIIGAFSILLFRYFLTEHTADYHAQSMLTKYYLIKELDEKKNVDVPFQYEIQQAPRFSDDELSFYWQAIRSRIQEQLKDNVELRHSLIDGDIYLWFSSSTEKRLWVGIQLSHKKSLFRFYAGIYIVIVLILSLIPSYFFARGISKPIKDLSEAAEVIAGGGVPKVVPKTWPNEIFRLAQVQEMAAEKLRDQSKSKEEMLLGISHDLRTPLTRARLAVDFLEKYDAELVHGVVDDLDEINQIIDQFIIFSRDGLNHKKEQADINHLVSGIVEKHKNIQLVGSSSLYAKVNELSIKRMLNNLINNAVKYGEPPVTVVLEQSDTEWGISVIDQGDGIPSMLVEEVVKPFTTLDKAGGQGKSGLGLAIVDRIVKNHKGSLSFSKLNDGRFAVKVRFSFSE